MAFQVFQDGTPCAAYAIDTFHEAVVFAFHWCYPYGIDVIKKNVDSGLWKMDVGVEYDMGMGSPVMMCIREI